jgi:heme exporter protein D
VGGRSSELPSRVSPTLVLERLNMNWSEFFSMGGYAFYVWGSYLATLILMGGEVLSLLRRRKAVRHQRQNQSETRK